MFLKSFGFLAPVALGGLYMMGGFGGGYERKVERPPAEVMAAVSDLSITDQPGSPGTDPSRSGGVLPTFVLERGADSMTWKVMSGTQVATTMTAHFEPLDGGTRMRVTTSVKRGDAPDDFVSPAFQSNGVTAGCSPRRWRGNSTNSPCPLASRPRNIRRSPNSLRCRG